MSEQVKVDMDKIIDKISKLFALSESSNEHEAESALLKAQEYLVKHNLTMKDIDSNKTIRDQIDNPIVDEFSGKTYTKATWKIYLAMVLADNFKCYAFSRTRKTCRIYFMGRKQDVFICNLAFDYAETSIYSAVAKIKAIYTKIGRSTAGIEMDYAKGFTAGLKKKFEDQKKNNQEWALVLVKDEGLVGKHDLMKWSSKTNKAHSVTHSDAYGQGHEAGNRFGITDRIAE